MQSNLNSKQKWEAILSTNLGDVECTNKPLSNLFVHSFSWRKHMRHLIKLISLWIEYKVQVSNLFDKLIQMKKLYSKVYRWPLWTLLMRKNNRQEEICWRFICIMSLSVDKNHQKKATMKSIFFSVEYSKLIRHINNNLLSQCYIALNPF